MEKSNYHVEKEENWDQKSKFLCMETKQGARSEMTIKRIQKC